MADFTIDTAAVRRAAEKLQRTARLVEPEGAALAVSADAVASDAVFSALNPATIAQGARARKLAEQLESLAQSLSDGADAVEQQDQSLADRLEG